MSHELSEDSLFRHIKPGDGIYLDASHERSFYETPAQAEAEKRAALKYSLHSEVYGADAKLPHPVQVGARKMSVEHRRQSASGTDGLADPDRLFSSQGIADRAKAESKSELSRTDGSHGPLMSAEERGMIRGSFELDYSRLHSEPQLKPWRGASQASTAQTTSARSNTISKHNAAAAVPVLPRLSAADEASAPTQADDVDLSTQPATIPAPKFNRKPASAQSSAMDDAAGGSSVQSDASAAVGDRPSRAAVLRSVEQSAAGQSGVAMGPTASASLSSLAAGSVHVPGQTDTLEDMYVYNTTQSMTQSLADETRTRDDARVQGILREASTRHMPHQPRKFEKHAVVEIAYGGGAYTLPGEGEWSWDPWHAPAEERAVEHEQSNAGHLRKTAGRRHRLKDDSVFSSVRFRQDSGAGSDSDGGMGGETAFGYSSLSPDVSHRMSSTAADGRIQSPTARYKKHLRPGGASLSRSAKVMGKYGSARHPVDTADDAHRQAGPAAALSPTRRRSIQAEAKSKRLHNTHQRKAVAMLPARAGALGLMGSNEAANTSIPPPSSYQVSEGMIDAGILGVSLRNGLIPAKQLRIKYIPPHDQADDGEVAETKVVARKGGGQRAKQVRRSVWGNDVYVRPKQAAARAAAIDAAFGISNAKDRAGGGWGPNGFQYVVPRATRDRPMVKARSTSRLLLPTVGHKTTTSQRRRRPRAHVEVDDILLAGNASSAGVLRQAVREMGDPYVDLPTQSPLAEDSVPEQRGESRTGRRQGALGRGMSLSASAPALRHSHGAAGGPGGAEGVEDRVVVGNAAITAARNNVFPSWLRGRDDFRHLFDRPVSFAHEVQREAQIQVAVDAGISRERAGSLGGDSASIGSESHRNMDETGSIPGAGSDVADGVEEGSGEQTGQREQGKPGSRHKLQLMHNPARRLQRRLSSMALGVPLFQILASIMTEENQNRSTYECMTVRHALRGHPFMTKLSASQRGAVYAEGVYRYFDKGELICAEGELGTKVFIVLAGTVDVSTAALGNVAVLQRGDTFGGVAVLQTGRRIASCHGGNPAGVEVILLSDSLFRKIQFRYQKIDTVDTVAFLAKVPIMSQWTRGRLARVAKILTVKRFQPHEIVFKQGEVSHFVVFVRVGGLVLYRKDVTVGRNVIPSADSRRAGEGEVLVRKRKELVRIGQVGECGMYGLEQVVQRAAQPFTVVAEASTELYLLHKQYVLENPLIEDMDETPLGEAEAKAQAEAEAKAEEEAEAAERDRVLHALDNDASILEVDPNVDKLRWTPREDLDGARSGRSSRVPLSSRAAQVSHRVASPPSPIQMKPDDSDNAESLRSGRSLVDDMLEGDLDQPSSLGDADITGAYNDSEAADEASDRSSHEQYEEAAGTDGDTPSRRGATQVDIPIPLEQIDTHNTRPHSRRSAQTTSRRELLVETTNTATKASAPAGSLDTSVQIRRQSVTAADYGLRERGKLTAVRPMTLEEGELVLERMMFRLDEQTRFKSQRSNLPLWPTKRRAPSWGGRPDSRAHVDVTSPLYPGPATASGHDASALRRERAAMAHFLRKQQAAKNLPGGSVFGNTTGSGMEASGALLPDTTLSSTQRSTLGSGSRRPDNGLQAASTLVLSADGEGEGKADPSDEFVIRVDELKLPKFQVGGDRKAALEHEASQKSADALIASLQASASCGRLGRLLAAAGDAANTSTRIQGKYMLPAIPWSPPMIGPEPRSSHLPAASDDPPAQRNRPASLELDNTSSHPRPSLARGLIRKAQADGPPTRSLGAAKEESLAAASRWGADNWGDESLLNQLGPQVASKSPNGRLSTGRLSGRRTKQSTGPSASTGAAEQPSEDAVRRILGAAPLDETAKAAQQTRERAETEDEVARAERALRYTWANQQQHLAGDFFVS